VRERRSKKSRHAARAARRRLPLGDRGSHRRRNQRKLLSRHRPITSWQLHIMRPVLMQDRPPVNPVREEDHRGPSTWKRIAERPSKLWSRLVNHVEARQPAVAPQYTTFGPGKLDLVRSEGASSQPSFPSAPMISCRTALCDPLPGRPPATRHHLRAWLLLPFYHYLLGFTSTQPPAE
jgi:hypothetical protein